MNLQQFLSTKPLYYKKFDPTRMQRAYNVIKDKLTSPPIIHIIGTNGKGTTGRFLAGMLKLAGKRVGHYTSPHTVAFNERIWINGKYITDQKLEEMHQRLQQLLPQEIVQELSYFEYTTFLAMLAFEGLDFAVVEAGLGGEYDATAVFPNILTLVTPIDYDHQDFLGQSIEEIATTKLKAVKKMALIGAQSHQEVFAVAQKLGIKYEKVIIDKVYKDICWQEGLAPFYAANLALAAAGAKRVGIEPDLRKAVQFRLPGRTQRVGNIILDVGHNLLAARALAAIIDKETILIYNTYADKEYKKILKIFAPKIKEVQILPVKNERIVAPQKLQDALEELGLRYRFFECILPEENYLVFGSFSVVEEFVKRCGLAITNI
ncbi:bifunctional folylpolyglutamate synthase/dihydrofolate synthase [Nitratiruptor tergarcus]|uniref:Dihydrofolate synthase / folylpolyglutamate synthase n=1 Tax=Nitratiruptor tergarcus DSM 16512 TaxID=1069081 RepID=A0A1W1WPN0_9BACT|nr:Mur ligase family protein [Nitratiruptor tergarcus]SMC08268.1 dihydrofolate synthase / folylpolyglutamate synthase [Nitratiruptor tergarcus DSM 16512]